MRHEILEEPAHRDSTLGPPSASTGPLKNVDASPAARKAHAHEIHEKTGSISNTCKPAAMARTGRYEEEALHKAGVGGAKTYTNNHTSNLTSAYSRIS
jgi:hypothetical protein